MVEPRLQSFDPRSLDLRSLQNLNISTHPGAAAAVVVGTAAAAGAAAAGAAAAAGEAAPSGAAAASSNSFLGCSGRLSSGRFSLSPERAAARTLRCFCCCCCVLWPTGIVIEKKWWCVAKFCVGGESTSPNPWKSRLQSVWIDTH